MNNLEKYGVNDYFTAQAIKYPELNMARVISQHKNLYKIIALKGECLAEVSGNFSFKKSGIFGFPVVGDFVMCESISTDGSHAIIHEVLERRSLFERSAVGKTNQTQVVAANVDIIFICMSLNNDYNLSRLERYLSAAWNSRAIPVVILTKSDLCDELSLLLSEVSTVAMGVDILVTSSHERISYNQLLPYLKKGVTASFIGSSGVGKSTLINCLVGQELLATSTIRRDDKGRHTTSRRELIALPDGGVVIDTPGMREFGVESIDLSRTFSDIDALVKKCKFSDCQHNNEPGCAVVRAIDNGELDLRRLKSYMKLQNEESYSGLSSKQIEVEKLNRMFSQFGGMKKARKFIKYKEQKKYY